MLHVAVNCMFLKPLLYPILLKYIDVMREKETDSESAAEHTTDDSWNFDGAVTLSGHWVGRARFQVLWPRRLGGCKWVNSRQTKDSGHNTT